MISPPRLVILIVTYNSAREIDTALRSLTRPAPATSHEIVLVDNASRDGTAGHVRAAGHTAADRIDDHLRFAAATIAVFANRLPSSSALNPDTRCRLARSIACAHLDARPDVATCAADRVRRWARRALVRPMIAPLAELRQKVLVVGNDRGVRPIVSMVDRMTRQTHDVDWVSGACLLIRRAELEAVGLLDERFFLYTEDVDLCASVRARGRTVRFAADVEIQHLRGRSAGTTTAAAYRAVVAFYAKHHPAGVPWLRLPEGRGEHPITRNGDGCTSPISTTIHGTAGREPFVTCPSAGDVCQACRRVQMRVSARRIGRRVIHRRGQRASAGAAERARARSCS